jgi:hypothetical protein
MASSAICITWDETGALWATAPPEAGLRWMLAAVDALAALTKALPRGRVVVDLSKLSNHPGFVAKSIFGEHAAMNLSHCEKVACLVPPAFHTGTSEVVAQQRGLDLRVFTSADAMHAWLARDGVS